MQFILFQYFDNFFSSNFLLFDIIHVFVAKEHKMQIMSHVLQQPIIIQHLKAVKCFSKSCNYLLIAFFFNVSQFHVLHLMDSPSDLLFSCCVLKVITINILQNFTIAIQNFRHITHKMFVENIYIYIYLFTSESRIRFLRKLEKYFPSFATKF